MIDKILNKKIIMYIFLVIILYVILKIFIIYNNTLKQEKSFNLMYGDNLTKVSNVDFNMEFAVNKKCVIEKGPGELIQNHFFLKDAPFWIGRLSCGDFVGVDLIIDKNVKNTEIWKTINNSSRFFDSDNIYKIKIIDKTGQKALYLSGSRNDDGVRLIQNIKNSLKDR